MSDSMIEQSAERLFSDHVDRAMLERFEAGQWPQALWQQVVDQGLTHALATEESGGIAASWAEAYPILRAIGHWQVPLPLAETMIIGPPRVLSALDSSGVFTIFATVQAARHSSSVRRCSVLNCWKIRVASTAIGLLR